MTTYEVIQHQEVGAGGAASITFSSIPTDGTYTDLVLMVSSRAGSTYIDIKLNDSSTSFSGRYLYGTGSAVGSGTQAQFLGVGSNTSNTANTFGSLQAYFPNYASSSYKSFSVESVQETNATGAEQQVVAGLWSNTAAINSITIYPEASQSFAQYSSVTLIGIKQAALPTPTDVYSDSLLEEQILTSSAASVTFSNLDTYAALGYTNLQIRMVTKATATNNDWWPINVEYNGDTTASNYARHVLEGNGSSVASAGATSNKQIAFTLNNYSTNAWSAAVIDLVDLFDSSKNTTARTLSGSLGGTNRIQLFSNVWLNTAAVTSIKLLHTDSSFLTGSRFSLYGSK